MLSNIQNPRVALLAPSDFFYHTYKENGGFYEISTLVGLYGNFFVAGARVYVYNI